MTKRPFSIRCLDASQAFRQTVVRVWEMLESALAMGLIRDETFTAFDTYPFDETRSINLTRLSEKDWSLKNWQRMAIEDAFENATFETNPLVLVVAAGGLQEMVALNQHGYETYGVEYGPVLFQKSQQWLIENGETLELQLGDRYQIPAFDVVFDAAFVARHYYSHIRTSEQRVEFLRGIRKQLAQGAPLILSYYVCEQRSCEQQPTFSIQQKLANFIRKTLRRGDELVSVGDHMDPESALYHHHFTDEEVGKELRAAGFEITSQNTTWLGWTVSVRAVQSAHAEPSANNRSPDAPTTI